MTIKGELREERKRLRRLERKLRDAAGLAAYAYFGRMAARSQDPELRAAWNDLQPFVEYLGSQLRDTSAATKESADKRKKKTDARIAAATIPANESKKQIAIAAGMKPSALSEVERRRKK